jgi:polar amino acid transport system substrate-binding protein
MTTSFTNLEHLTTYTDLAFKFFSKSFRDSLRFLCLLWVVVAICFVFVPVAMAQPAGTAAKPNRAATTDVQKILATRGTLTVATRVIPPFVMSEGNQLRGFSIDLWREIGRELGVKTRFVPKPNVKEVLKSVGDGEVQAAISAISITAERERNYDFSQPMFGAGLQILVRAENSGGPNFLQLFNSPELLSLLFVLPLLILVPAHIIWLVERNHPDGLIENKKYWPGIGKAIWWAAGTVGAQADEMPRSPLGRFVAVLMMFAGVVFVAFFTAALTTSLTVQQLRGDINGPSDLPGKRVATTAGSTSATYLRENRARVQEFASIEEAYKALDSKKVDAVVFDSPVLLYYTTQAGSGKAQVVGPVFRPEDYGILFPKGSPMRKRVNEILLRLKEDGTYQSLYEKWFGVKS